MSWTARIACLVCALGLLACPSGDDGPCEDDAVRCVGNSTIEYCLDGEWQGPEDCPPREFAGGPPVNTYCYEEQGVCAP